MGCKTLPDESSNRQGNRVSTQNSVSSIFSFEKPNEVNLEIQDRQRSRVSQFQKSRAMKNSLMVSKISRVEQGPSSYVHSQRDDVFDIGIIALSMLTLEYEDYFDQQGRPKLQFIHFTVNNLDKRGVSWELFSLLKCMLARKD